MYTPEKEHDWDQLIGLMINDKVIEIIENALDWISFTSFQSVLSRKRLINFGKLKETMIIISRNWTQKFFNCSLYNGSVVLTNQCS